MDTKTKVDQTVAFIRKQTKISPQVGVTLGSGLASFGNTIEVDAEILFADLPHFPPPTVEGHPGKLILGKVDDQPVAVLQGRIHYYEGHDPEAVMFSTRVLGQLGIKCLILTNAAGGLQPKMKPGDFMVITDHINLMGYNPLRGPNVDEWGPRFPDMTQVYSPRLREKLIVLLNKLNVSFHEGIYCGVSGPTYETPAEVRYLAQIGGGAVGMSTVPEAIAARHMGVEVVGISCITNLGSGLSPTPLTHDEVKETAAKVEVTFCQFLKDFVANL